jgi:hypothetical protein
MTVDQFHQRATECDERADKTLDPRFASALYTAAHHYRIIAVYLDLLERDQTYWMIRARGSTQSPG